jgi:hypothetical protein
MGGEMTKLKGVQTWVAEGTSYDARLRRYLAQNEEDLQTAHARAGSVDRVLRVRGAFQ